MANVIFNLIYITFITVFIVDLSGFIASLRHGLSEYLKVSPDRIRLKPLDCSLCLSFWAQFIYLIIIGADFHFYPIACLLSFLTPITADMMYGLRELLTRITRKIK